MLMISALARRRRSWRPWERYRSSEAAWILIVPTRVLTSASCTACFARGTHTITSVAMQPGAFREELDCAAGSKSLTNA
jgi:hypothetical protein